MKLRTLVLLALVPCLMGAKGSGCQEQVPVPSNQWIEMNLPKEILTCKAAPKSPGAKANDKQRAAYLIALYGAWEDCGGKLDDVRTLYGKYKAQIAITRGSTG